MNYREQYAKKRAVQMYYQGADRMAVINMLLEEGAGEKAESLALEYFNDFDFIQNHHKKQSRKAAGGYITIGLVFILGSIAYGLLTYFALGTGNFVVLSGLLVIGLISLVKGTLDKNK